RMATEPPAVAGGSEVAERRTPNATILPAIAQKRSRNTGVCRGPRLPAPVPLPWSRTRFSAACRIGAFHRVSTGFNIGFYPASFPFAECNEGFVMQNLFHFERTVMWVAGQFVIDKIVVEAYARRIGCGIGVVHALRARPVNEPHAHGTWLAACVDLASGE